MVIGVLIDAGRADLTDSVTAFSVTPAFYTFTREVKNLAGLRARRQGGLAKPCVGLSGRRRH